MKRNYDEWLATMKKGIEPFSYFTNFNKVYRDIEPIKVQLYMLDSLIGSKNIEEDFLNLVKKYPEVLKAVPILIAKRQSEIYIYDNCIEYDYNFKKVNYTPEQYALFMRNSGLFELIQRHLVSHLYDYVLGVEVGLDSNARKNRSGHLMEDLVESYLIKEGLIKDKTYFKEMTYDSLKKKFSQYGFDEFQMGSTGKVGKRFDFVFVGAYGDIYAVECNYYANNGSKQYSIAGDYTELDEQAKKIPHLHLVWITDGQGWNNVDANLKDAYEKIELLYNLNDLDNGALKPLVGTKENIESLFGDE